MLRESHSRKSLISSGQPRLRHSYSNPAFATSASLRAAPQRDPPGAGRNRGPSRGRAIFKNGGRNIYATHVDPKLGLRYLHDAFTSLVDVPWRYTLLFFGLAYFVSWLLFALVWWLIVFTHGDLEDEHLPQNQAESNWSPCVLNIHNFTSCYLFSIETQYTIGYGVRTITEECPEAIFLMSMQAIIGMAIDGFVLGVVFAKMARPKLRNRTILFSRNAVVNKRDDELCLMFRVGDMRKKSLIGATIRAQLIKPKRFEEGEIVKNHRSELDLTIDGGDLFLWPVLLIHRINERSPFYEMSASDTLKEKFEILVVLEASVESTGQSIQARTSYLPNEILWGFRFEPMVDHLRHETAYDVNYSRFNSVYSTETPLCSAAELAAFNRAQDTPDSPTLPEATPGPSRSFDDDNKEDDDDDDEDELLLRITPPPSQAESSRSTHQLYPIIHSTSDGNSVRHVIQSYV